MFKCENCKTVVPAKTQANRIVIEKRRKRYPARERVNKKVNNEGKVVYVDDPGGIGYETVREITVCPECALKLTENEP